MAGWMARLAWLAGLAGLAGLDGMAALARLARLSAELPSKPNVRKNRQPHRKMKLEF